VLLAAPFQVSPAAFSLSTTVPIVLVALAVIALLIARYRATSRGAAPPAASPPREDEVERRQADTLRISGHEWPHDPERFRTPFDQVENYAIILLDPEGKPTSWNAGIRRVLGYDKADFLRTTAADLYPADVRRSGAPAEDLAAAARKGRVTVDRWLVRKDGSRFWGSLSTTSVHDREGRLLGYARRVRDLTQNKDVEEQLQRNQDSLELALEAAGLGTWEYDLSTGGSAMDPRARALFGIGVDEPSTTARWLDALHPDDRQTALEGWEHALGNREAYSAEYRVVWPDGSIHWIMAVGRFVTDPSTRSPLRFTGVVLDLTERRRTEAHLQESLRLEAIGRLAGGIAHDLNNMLAAILGFGDLLGRSLEPDDPRAADVEQIIRAAARSAGLTRQLLAFARRELTQPRALDINSVIHHAHALLPPILGENVELELRLAPALGAVYADARQVEQIVMNLVLNARDAMPQGGRVTIETGTTQLSPGERELSGRFTMLSVTDTGHGMDAATLQRIWEPFFTTKPPGHGTGLGLASVYGSVKQGGGFVWADSEPGRGTTVQVYWPEVPAEVEPAVEPAPPAPLVGGTETILIVEDEDLVRALGVRALKTFGYTCYGARDAAEALQLLHDPKVSVDLVVTDVVMPGMSGGALGSQVARLRPGMPVLYTSAFSDEDVIRRGMLGEGRPFLQKPFTPTELARMVRETLDATGAERGERQTVE
jgi:two-component system, cell cycle sensor histidine kinase and response regulator CckA